LELISLIVWLVVWAPLIALLEYGTHRWIQHRGIRILDPKLEHLKDHGASPLFILLAAWGLATGALTAVATPGAALLIWIFVHAYLWTRIHRAIHGIEANWFGRTGPLLRFYRARHLKHHANARVNFGAVFPWTDYLFLTARS
jgi:hypothetical protein